MSHGVLLLLHDDPTVFETTYAKNANRTWPSHQTSITEAIAELDTADKLSMLQGAGTGPYAGSLPAIERLGIPARTLEGGPQGVRDDLTSVSAWAAALTTKRADSCHRKTAAPAACN